MMNWVTRARLAELLDSDTAAEVIEEAINEVVTAQLRGDLWPSKKHGQLDASQYQEQQHDHFCPCTRAGH